MRLVFFLFLSAANLVVADVMSLLFLLFSVCCSFVLAFFSFFFLFFFLVLSIDFFALFPSMDFSCTLFILW